MGASNKLRALCAVGLAGLFTGLPIAGAQTPDGETPAEEDVCSELSGAQYGLCNAYCEALDCHLPELTDSKQACETVLNNYRKHSDGIDPPCVASACADECRDKATEEYLACLDQCGDDPKCKDLSEKDCLIRAKKSFISCLRPCILECSEDCVAQCTDGDGLLDKACLKDCQSSCKGIPPWEPPASDCELACEDAADDEEALCLKKGGDPKTCACRRQDLLAVCLKGCGIKAEPCLGKL